ncbi:hypothetical protein NMY22_g18909 [Coprinellus aureogranulatus]|nr:hypothetical protein NMY22_g18909 [Coprinellus aureogranulatus]
MRDEDMVLFTANWIALTDLSLGPDPSPMAVLTPNHIIPIVTRATNLKRLALEFTHGGISVVGLPPPWFPRVHLPNLHSLSIIGDNLPVSFVDALDIPSLARLRVAPRRRFVPGDGQTRALLALIRNYGSQLIHVVFDYQTVTNETLIRILKGLSNAEVLELSTFGCPVIHAQGLTELDFLFPKLIPTGNSEVEGESTGETLCPNMRTFICNVHEATDEVKEGIIDFVSSRRSGRKEGSVRWLEEVCVSFSNGSVEGMIDQLQSRGTSTSFICFKTKGA